MSLNGINQILPLLPTDLMNVVIDRVNENSSVTNSLLTDGLTTEVKLSQIGDTTTILQGGTLAEQSNYTYSRLLTSLSEAGQVVEFLATPPVKTVPEDVLPPFYFDTVLQNFMILNGGDEIYYPAFGCNSIMDNTLAAAPIWDVPDPAIPPAPPPVPPVGGCYIPNPSLSAGEVRLIKEFPNAIDILSAETFGNDTYILSRNQAVMDLYKYDITTDNLAFVVQLPVYRKGAIMVVDPSNTTVFILGGRELTGFFSKEVYSVDIATATVNQLIDLPVAIEFSDYSYDGTQSKAYMFGGTTSFFGGGWQTAPYNKITEFDTTTGIATEVATMPASFSGMASVRVANSAGLIHVAGGRLANDGKNTSLSQVIWKFDPLILTFEQAALLPSGRSDGVFYDNGTEMYYVGGFGPVQGLYAGAVTDVLQIFPYGTNWSVFKIGTINTSHLATFGSEVDGCGYATFISSNGTSKDTFFIVGL